MPERARVTSIEALESFRVALIIYLEKAVRVLDEVSDEVLRTKLWVQNDARERWEREVKRRTRDLQEKQQELFGARLSKLQEVTAAQQMAVLRAKRALEEAEAKLSSVKQWNQQYDSRVVPFAKEADKLRDVLVSHMSKAVFNLNQVAKHLAAYAELGPPEISTLKEPSSKPPTTDKETATTKTSGESA
jgi:hypothetical protein